MISCMHICSSSVILLDDPSPQQHRLDRDACSCGLKVIGRFDICPIPKVLAFLAGLAECVRCNGLLCSEALLFQLEVNIPSVRLACPFIAL